jgi:hypothetical protein
LILVKVEGEDFVSLVWQDDDVFWDEFWQVLLYLVYVLAECVLDDLAVLLFDLGCFGVVYLVLQVVYQSD